MFAGRSLSEVEEEALEIITNRKRPGKTSKRGNRILDGGRMNQSPERDGHETLIPPIVRESPEEDGSDGDQQNRSRYNTALSSSGLLSPGDRPASSCSGSEATNSAKKSDISLSQTHTAHHLNCKMCNRTISGVHFYCIHVKCTGFGICDNCHKYRHQSHPEDHKFLQFENLEDSAPMRDQPDVSLSQGNSIVIGLRVYTQQHAARIAGQLRHGDIIRQSLPPEKSQ
ncbi:hypothetical protein FRC03_008688 [Tulasnella sp. 419]|nr:hypothetical protein FRC03_008688 [Tulasnella sp. 419]